MKIKGELPTREEFLKAVWKQLEKRPSGTLLKVYADVSGMSFRQGKPPVPEELPKGVVDDLEEFADALDAPIDTGGTMAPNELSTEEFTYRIDASGEGGGSNEPVHG